MDLKIIKDNQSEFTKFYNKHYSDVFTTIKYIVKDDDIAAELANDTFLKVLEVAESYENISIKMWLKTIASRKAIDWYRSNKIEMQHIENYAVQLDEDQDTAEKNMIRSEEHNIQLQILDRLPYRYKTILIKKYLHGRTYEDLANEYNTNVSNIKSLVARSKKKLKTLMNSAQ